VLHLDEESKIEGSFRVLGLLCVCTVLQCAAVWCNVLHCVAVCCILMKSPKSRGLSECWVCNVLQCVAVCCSVLQCVAVWCSVLYSVAV